MFVEISKYGQYDGVIDLVFDIKMHLFASWDRTRFLSVNIIVYIFE